MKIAKICMAVMMSGLLVVQLNADSKKFPGWDALWQRYGWIVKQGAPLLASAAVGAAAGAGTIWCFKGKSQKPATLADQVMEFIGQKAINVKRADQKILKQLHQKNLIFAVNAGGDFINFKGDESFEYIKFEPHLLEHLNWIFAVAVPDYTL